MFKARLKVADLFHHANHLEVFTAALTKRETIEHFLLRVLGFCALSYNENTFLNQKSDKQMPDVWCEDENKEVILALYVSELELQELNRLSKLYNKVILLLVDAEQWFSEISPHLIQFHNISVFTFDKHFIDQLQDNLTNSIHWDILIEQSSFSVSDKQDYYQTDVKQLC